jgi:short-subunit dehydrogenase
MATARLLRDRGYRVLGTSRDPERIPEDQRLDGVTYLPLDLAVDASVVACAAAAGPVDVLVNNAGESQSGPLEELPREAIERLFQLNVFAPVRLTQLLTPGMRERRYGRVVMIGSMLGSFPVAYRSSYSASKAAIRVFATAARHEFSPYDVWFTTVEPGSINTGVSARRTRYVAPESPFADECATVVGRLDRMEAAGISPDDVAETVLTAIEADPPRSYYARGAKGSGRIFVLRRLAPRQVVERRMSRVFGLQR